MKTLTKWRLVAMPIALAGIAIPAVACEQLGDNPAATLCCTEFTPGADLSLVDWKIPGPTGAKFGAFMQAAADFTGGASAAVNDVAASCQAIAIDLGSDPNLVKDTDSAARAQKWCAEATTQIKASLAGASVTVNYQPPACTVSVNAQANCEAKCQVDAACMGTLGDVTVRCQPGELSGRCEGMCTARCEGSANLAVTCDGACSGSCEGTCDGVASTGACPGKCAGKCRGSCQVAAQGGAMCEGDCTGGCMGTLKAPKCKGELTPPDASCKADATCEGSCRASASAKAECKDPSLDISNNIDPKLIATLKLNLPKLISVAVARGQILTKNAQAVVGFGADFSGQSTDLSVKAVACSTLAVSSVGTAASNVAASLQGSLSVISAVGVAPPSP